MLTDVTTVQYQDSQLQCLRRQYIAPLSTTENIFGIEDIKDINTALGPFGKRSLGHKHIISQLCTALGSSARSLPYAVAPRAP